MATGRSDQKRGLRAFGTGGEGATGSGQPERQGRGYELRTDAAVGRLAGRLQIPADNRTTNDGCGAMQESASVDRHGYPQQVRGHASRPN